MYKRGAPFSKVIYIYINVYQHGDGSCLKRLSHSLNHLNEIGYIIHIYGVDVHDLFVVRPSQGAP